jgi:trigger factor
MNATLDKKDALNGTITVNIAADDYMPGIDKKISDYRKKANIPGFRVGHAPKAMVEKAAFCRKAIMEISVFMKNLSG